MNYSHLYLGFRHVGILPSIHEQRRIQRAILCDIFPLIGSGDFLSIGCGYGEELDFFLSDEGEQIPKSLKELIALDIADVKNTVYLQPMISQLNSKFTFHQHDLLELDKLGLAKRPLIVQCGFVMEDIEYSCKDLAFELIREIISDDGWFIYSEMFLDNLRQSDALADEDRQRTVASLYDLFINEAEISLNEGRMSKRQYNELCGDGKTPGLYRTRQQAIDGKRDFFESLEKTLQRFRELSFTVAAILDNKYNPFLKIILAKS